MKLNNKGFAISAVIYSALVMFLLVISFFLAALSSRNNQLAKVIESASDTFVYQEIAINETLTNNNYYVTKYRGKYVIATPNGTGSILLPKDVLIIKSLDGFKLESINNETIDFSTYNNEGKYKFLEIDTNAKSSSVEVVAVYTNEGK